MRRLKLGALTQIRTGKLDVNAGDVEGKYPFFTCANTAHRINDFAFDGEAVIVAGNGDLNVKYYDGKFNAYQRTYVIQRKEDAEISMKYLFYFMETYMSHLRRNAIGGIIKYIKLGHLSDAMIPLPPLKDQKRIAYLLSKVEGLIAQRKQHLQQLDDLLKSVFNDMFGDSELNQKKLPEQELDISITHLTSGGRSWAKYYAPTGKRFIRSLDVQMNAVGDDDIVFVDPPETTEANRTRVMDGDVLLTITGSKVGRVCFVPDGFGEAYVSQHVAIIRTENINPIYLSYFLSMPSCGQRQIKKAQYGQAKPGINLTQIRQLKILHPKTEQQDKFANIVSFLCSLKLEYSERINDLKKLFAVVSQQAFSGQLDVSRIQINPPDEIVDTRTVIQGFAATTHGFAATTHTFTLPSPTDVKKLKSPRSRKTALKNWLSAYSMHLGDEPVEADSFIALVQQKLSDLESDSDIEWYSHEIGIEEYDEMKKWIFEVLKSNRLSQNYDDETNRVRVSAAKE